MVRNGHKISKNGRKSIRNALAKYVIAITMIFLYIMH